jgi:HNH endonuclease
MSASGYTVWETLFPKEEILYTERAKNPFRLLVVARNGIELRVPVKEKAKDRTLILRYDRLDALWKSRDSVKDSKKRLTTSVNEVWKKKGGPGTDYRNEAQYWALVCARERRELRDEEANRDVYSPQEDDQRQVVGRQIRERRGQQQFRDALLERHGNRCLVTACTVLAVLEAAHIHPYRGENDNHPDNGLLLRADIHTLFDLNLLGIEPDHFQVELHPSLAKEYRDIAGTKLVCAPAHPPSQEALRERYKVFQQKLSEVEQA